MKRIGDEGERNPKPPKFLKLMLSSPKVHISDRASQRGHDDTSRVSNVLEEDYTNSSGTIIVDPLLWNGSIVWKVPFHTVGSSQRRFLRLRRSCEHSENNIPVKVKEDGVSTFAVKRIASPIALELVNPQIEGSKSSKFFVFDDITAIREGHQTPAFLAFIARHGHFIVPSGNHCFSICFRHRSIDLYTDTEQMRSLWVKAILELKGQSTLISFPRKQYLTFEDKGLTAKTFFRSARCGDAGTFQWYLENGFNVDIMENDELRDTPLIAACRLGRTDIVQIALEFDAKNDPHPEFGQTALQVAVASGYTDCVQLILETAALSFADKVIVNHVDDGKEAPLHVASRCGSLDILKLLIRHGANLNSVDAKEKTCLHCAAQYGHSRCLNFLLNAGCKSILEQRDYQGLTCLHTAVKADNVECAQLLLNNGSNIRAVTLDGDSIFNIARRQKLRRMSRIIHRYQEHGLDFVKHSFFDKDSSHDHSEEDIYGPLSIFHGLNVYRTPRGPPKCTTTSDDERQIEQSHISGSDRCNNVNNCQSNGFPGRFESFQNPMEMFRLGVDTWYILYCSGYPYFVREADGYSQVRFLCAILTL